MKGFSSKIYGKLITPLSYYVKGDIRFKYFEEYKKNLLKSRSEIQKYQFDRLKKLVLHAYETVPYYRHLFDKNKIKPENINSIDDFKRIPVLDKKIVSSNPDMLLSSKR